MKRLPSSLAAAARRGQRGLTMLMVLILMSVMLLGSLALARITEANYLISGNVATKEASMHAAEVGWNTAFAAVAGIANTTNAGTAIGGWYFPTMQATDAAGVPVVNWNGAATVAGGVGRYTVAYIVDRLCTVGSVTVASRECLVRQDTSNPVNMSSDKGDHEEKTAQQFRITIRVTDARGTQTWTQAIVN